MILNTDGAICIGLGQQKRPHNAARGREMIDESDIERLAGKNAKAIWTIDLTRPYDEIEYTVWLKDEYIQEGYNNSMIVFDESEDPETVRHLFSLIKKKTQ